MTLQEQEIQDQNKNDQLLEAAKQLLSAAGIDANAFDTAINAIQTAKDQSSSIVNPQKKNYLDKTFIYEDVDTFIYKRGDTKGIWYFRIWDTNKKKAIFRSLRTTDKTTAIAAARNIYIDIKGKIERGERLKQITTDELIASYIKVLEAKVTDTPHKGIVPKTFKSKKYWLQNWSDYIHHLHLHKTPIDKIRPHKTRGFSNWLDQRPKQTALHTGARSREQINNNVNAVLAMYNQLAVRERYISKDDIPQIDRLHYEIDDRVKRDIPTLEEYEKYYTYLKRVYVTKKHNQGIPSEELEKRKIFSEFILILANAGMRPKELLGIKKKEVKDLINQTEDDIKNGRQVIVIRSDNAKTGRSRSVVAPVKKRFERIYECYRKLGVTHEPNDFIFMNPNSNSKRFRESYGRMIMNNRLKSTLKQCGLQEQLTKEQRSISLYSFRHLYCFLSLINKVSIHILAENIGSSVFHISRTYGHINTQLHAEEITRGQSILYKTETTNEILPVAME